MEEYLPVDGFRSAVNVEHRRVSLFRIIADGLEHPSVYIPPLAVKCEFLRQCDIGVPERFAVEIADLFSFSAFQF